MEVDIFVSPAHGTTRIFMSKAPDPLRSQKVWHRVTLVKTLRQFKGNLRKIKGNLSKLKENLRGI